VIALLALATASVTEQSTLDFGVLFFKMLGALGAVTVFAILVLKFLVPRLSFAKRYHEEKMFNVISRYQLEPKKSLYLVKVSEKYLVLGVSDSAIQTLTTLTKEEALGEAKKADA